MNNSPDPPPLKGRAMIAAYREARFSQRPLLRTSMRQAHAALRSSREGRPSSSEPERLSPQALPGATVAATAETRSVFAGLVSLAVSGRTQSATTALAATAECAPADPAPAATMSVAPAHVAGTDVAPVDRTRSDSALTDSIPADTAQAGHPARDEHRPSPDSVMAHERPVPATPSPPTEQAAAISPPEAVAPPQAPPLATERQTATALDPPLAEIGLGPGMLIRLSQLGLRTTGELAQADAGELRLALGEISRLVDVETWITNAVRPWQHEGERQPLM